jgi:hypothetical protein
MQEIKLIGKLTDQAKKEIEARWIQTLTPLLLPVLYRMTRTSFDEYAKFIVTHNSIWSSVEEDVSAKQQKFKNICSLHLGENYTAMQEDAFEQRLNGILNEALCQVMFDLDLHASDE